MCQHLTRWLFRASDLTGTIDMARAARRTTGATGLGRLRVQSELRARAWRMERDVLRSAMEWQGTRGLSRLARSVLLDAMGALVPRLVWESGLRLAV